MLIIHIPFRIEMFGAPPTVINTYKRALFAARFMKPPSKYKRDLMKEKPRKNGPFENPVRRFVRLKEKERMFTLIPEKRLIPVPKQHKDKILQSLQNVPVVSQISLMERLKHLLSDDAVHQQIAENIFPFESSATPELRIWKRQLREIRRIYRAQFLQKLAEVTDDERRKQIEIMETEFRLKKERRIAKQDKLAEAQKRRAIVRDRRRLDTQLKMTAKLREITDRKARRIYFYSQLEANAANWNSEGISEAFGESSISREQSGLQPRLFDRNTSVPHLMHQMKLGQYSEKSAKKRLASHYDFYRKIIDESYKLLPEDAEPIVDPETARSREVTQSVTERAAARYASFSEDAKLQLLNEKIDLIKSKLDKEGALMGGSKDGGHWSLLLEQLEAAKAAYLENKASSDGQRRAESSV